GLRQRQGGHQRAHRRQGQTEGTERNAQEGRKAQSKTLTLILSFNLLAARFGKPGRALFFSRFFCELCAVEARHQAAGASFADICPSTSERRPRNHIHSATKAANAPIEPSRETEGAAVRLAANDR